MENQPYFHTAKAMQDIRIFIEAAGAKIRGVFPYTACQSKTVAQPPPGTRGAPTGGVSGAKRGRVPARFRSFPWCFQSHASVAVTGKKYVSERTAGKRRPPASHRLWSEAAYFVILNLLSYLKP